MSFGRLTLKAPPSFFPSLDYMQTVDEFDLKFSVSLIFMSDVIWRWSLNEIVLECF